MDAAIRVFEEDGEWLVDDPHGGPQSFETREEAVAAATLLAESSGRPVETPAFGDDGTG